MIRRLDPKLVVKIAGDGAVSSPNIHCGRLIVALVLDCSGRRDIADLIRLHDESDLGDVLSTWVKDLWHGNQIWLHLKFIRPTPAEAMIQFELPKHLVLVDSIIQNHACYIQSNEYGLRLSTAFNNTPRLLMEIPSEGLPFNWDRVIEKHLFRRFRSNGLSRIDAKQATKEEIKTSRDLFRLREVVQISKAPPVQ